MRNGGNNKYISPSLLIVFLAVVIALVGLSEINLVIFASDIAMVLAILPLEQRIRTVMKKEESKVLLQSESPLKWVTTCTRLSLVSLLSSLAYGVITGNAYIGVANPPIESPIFGMAILFFLFGFIYIIRIAEFLIDPASKANVFAGKAITMVLDVGFRIAFIVPIALFQIFNGIILYQILQGVLSQNVVLSPLTILYTFTLILSFVGMIPVAWMTVFHLKEPVQPRLWIALIGFISPWILLMVVTILIRLGANVTWNILPI